MTSKIDLTGQRFGRLVVIGDSMIRRDAKIVWHCRCDCGNPADVSTILLRDGRTTSCGCRRKETTSAMATKHGEHGSPEYVNWRALRERCLNPKHKNYPEYGGRGIKVCERWLNSFENFLADMGRRPFPEATVDRKENDGDYEPGNCRWATRLDQTKNRRCSK